MTDTKNTGLMNVSNGASDQTLIQLYYYPKTRSARVRWLLEELGLEYALEQVDLRHGMHKEEAYLAIHPLGKVPALQIDGTVIFETLAICLYLADRFWQCDLAPVHEEYVLRAEYYKWMAFSTGTLEPAIFEQSREQKARKQNIGIIDMGPALTPFKSAASYLEQTLADRSYLLDDGFSAADVMNGSLMMSADRMGLLGGFTNTKAWVERLKARAGYVLATSIQHEGAK